MKSLTAALLFTLSLSAQALQIEGRWMQGGFVSGNVAPGSSLTLDGQKVTVAPDGTFAFGLAFDAPVAATVAVTHPDGRKERHEYPVAQRQYPESRIDGLPGGMVTPPKAVLDRIAKDNADVGKARAQRRPVADFADGFMWPLKGSRISGEFGSKRILNGEPRQPHFGIDIAAPSGTPIRSSAAGVVTMAHPDLYFTGQTVIIDHGLGITTTYLHLSKTDVKVGQTVAKGEVIGQVGMTGRATGPHLCWRANWGGVRLDPSLLVDDQPAKTQARR